MAQEASGALSARSLRVNFVQFAAYFALCHAVATTPLVVSSSVLHKTVGYTGNAIMNLASVFSAFLLGAPMAACLGLKNAVLLGMSLYVVYAGMFAVAIVVQGNYAAQFALFALGSICAGVASGVLWTSQGGYFARTVDLLVQAEGTPRPELTSKQSSVFAALYLLFEVVAKLTWSLLDWAGAARWAIAVGFVAAGLLAMALMSSLVLDLKSAASAGPPRWTSKLQAAVRLWRDPTVFLLAGTNLTFGFCAAFMNGYVNAEFTQAQLGSFAVAMLAAMTAFVAFVVSNPLGPLTACVGKGPVVLLGAIFFAAVPLCVLSFRFTGPWHWWLVVLYLFQGSGRAVYEATNKAVFADFFPSSEDQVAAFANCMLQSTLAFAVCFFLSDFLHDQVLGGIVLGLAVLTPLGFLGALMLRRSAQARPLLEEQASSC